MSKEELGSQGLDPKPDLGSSQPRGAQNTPPASYTQNLGDYQLETLEVSDPEHPVVPQKVSADFGKIYRTGMIPKKRVLYISLAITIVVVIIVVAVMALLINKDRSPSASQASTNPIPVQDVTLEKPDTVSPGFTTEIPSLLVNGDLITTGSLKVLSGGFTTTFRVDNPTSDQIITLPNAQGVVCLDSNNCNYTTQADFTTLANQLTTRLNNIVVPPSGVTSLNGQDGAITLQGTTNQVTVTTNGATVTLSTAQDIATTSSPTFSSLVLSSNLNIGGTVTLPLNCSGLTMGGKLTTNGAGQIICDNDGGSTTTGTVTTPGGTVGTIPVFSNTEEIGDSIITQAAGTITVTGALSVTGLTTTNTLSVSNGISVVAGGINNNGTNITNAGAISGVTTLTASGNINTSAALQTNGTSRVDSSGNLVNIGSLTATGALTIASSGAGNDIIINGADTLDVQDPATFASTLGVTGAATFNGLTTFASNVSVGSNTISGTTAIIDFTNFDVAANGAISTNGGYTQTGAGANTFTGAVTLASLSSGFLEVNGAGLVSVGTLDLGSDTTGNYVATISSGNGISGSSNTEGGTPTIALSSLTADWVQSGAFDIVLDNAASGLRMLENVGGAFYGSFDVGDLTANQTFTFTEGGIVVTTGNVATYATTGVTAGAGLTGGGTVGALTVNVGAGNGVSVNANDISVVYGSSANTAVEGNTAITLTAGTNLTGGGVLTLGAGGTLTVNVTDDPVFSGVLEVQGGSILIGTATQAGVLEISDGSSNIATVHPSMLAQDTEYILPDPGSSSATICLDNGNCAGAGSSVTAIAPSVAGRIAVFTSGQDITGSWLFQNTNTIEVDNTKSLSLLGGNLTVTGNMSNTGNSTFGDAGSDTVTFNAQVNSHVLPAVNITYDLGSSTNRWRDLYLGGTSLHLGAAGNEVTFSYNTGTSEAQIDQNLVITNNKTLSVPGQGAGSQVFGASAGATGTSAIALGTSATANGNDAIALGTTSSATGTASVVIGSGASDGGNSQSVAIGMNALATAPNQLIVGSGGTALNQGYFGNGVTSTTPQAFTFNATGGSGNDITGANLSFAGGRGTGTGAGGALVFQTAAAGGVSGNTLNALTERARISSTGNFGIGGDTTPDALFSVGNTSQFQVNGTGAIAAATGITSSGSVNFTSGTLNLGAATGSTGALLLHDNDGVGSETITLTLPNVTASYTLTLPTAVGAVNQCLKAQNGTGVLFWDNCTGGAGGGLSGSGTNGRIARFTPNGTTIGDSSLTDDGTTATATGDVIIQGGDITVGTTSQTGSIILHDNDAGGGETVTLTAPNVSASYTLALPTAQGSNTQCLRVNGTGTLYFDTCSGGGSGTGVNSLNTKTGDLSLQGTANQVIVSSVDGTTIGLSLPQNIHSGATPTFNGVTIGTGTLTGTTAVIDFTNFDVLGNGNTSVGGTLSVTGQSTLANIVLGTANTIQANNLLQTAAGQDITINASNDDITFTAGGRTFVFPTSGGASQTICTTGVSCAAGGGQAVLLAPGSAQTDTSTDASLQINKTGASGNLAEFTVNGGQRFTVDYSGGLTLAGALNVGGLSTLANVTLGTANILKTNNIEQTAAGQNVSIAAGNDVITFTAGGRTFVFPTTGGASQTICTTGVTCTAGGGQAVLLAPGTAQTDSSTDASVQINKTGASGNLAEFTVGGLQRVTFNYSGGLTLAGDLAVNGGDITSSGGLNITPGGALVAGATGQTATFQGSVLTLTSNGAGNDVIINSADTIELQDNTNVSGGLYVSNNADIDGTLSVGTSDAFQVASNGDITTNGDLNLNGGNLNAAAQLIIASSGAGNDITIDGADQFIVQDDTLLNTNVTLGTDASNTITTNGVFQGANPFIFEGATADAFEFTIAISDPTADRTYTLPNSTALTDTFCLLTLSNCVGGAGGGAPNAAAYITFGNDATLTNERAIAVNTTNLTATDGGANGSYTINTVQDIDITSSPTFANQTLTGDLTLNGGDITSTTGSITVAPLAGSNFNVNLSTTGDFVVNTNQLYVDTSSGFVGIGNSNPSALFSVGASSQFQVNGNGSVSTTQSAVAGGQTALTVTPGAHTAVTSEINNFLVAGNTQTLTSGVSTQRFSLFAQPTITAGSALSTSSASTVAIAGAPAQAGSATITDTSALLIQSSAVGAATRSYGLNVNAQTGATNNYAAVFLGGNVGIGDSTPAGLFTVGASDAFQVNNSGAITASTGIATSGGYTQTGATGNTFTGASSFTAAGTALSVTNSASIGGTLAVALGTASNDAVVCRNGTGQLATCNSTFITAASLTLQNAYSGDVDGGDTTIGLTTADDSIIFSNPASGGTDSGYVFRVEQLNTGTVAGFEIAQAGTANAFRVNDDGTFTDSSPFIIDATGKVGIGIATASSLLHVQGNGSSLPSINNNTIAIFAQTLGSANNVNISLISGTSGNSKLNFGDTAAEGQGYIDYSNNTDSLAIGVNGAVAATFSSAGNLGIGTATFGTNNRLLVNAYSTVDALATAQINTNNAANKGLVVQGFSAQSADLLQLQDASGNTNAKFGSTGATLTLGRIAASGTVTQGQLILGDGTTNNYATTFVTDTMTVGSRTIKIPNTNGVNADVCLSTGNCAGAGSGVTQSGTNATGQIAFFTGASNISSSTAFNWDNTNGRLGINTATPTAVLTIAAAAQPSPQAGNGTAATAAVNITGTKGGNTTSAGANTAGSGGAVTITSGGGGDSVTAGTATAGSGGAVSIGAGAGGTVTSATATPGTGGAVTINSGSGGAGFGTSANGTGGAITIAAGAGGTGGSGSGGNGGTVTLQGGAAGASTNGNGGSIVLQGGAKSGSGTDGAVLVRSQSDTAAALKIQNAGATFDLLTAYTNTTGVTARKIVIGNGTPVLGASTTGGLYVTDSVEVAGQLLVGTTTNGVAVDSTNKQMRFTGTARNDMTSWLVPEFEGAIFRGDGADNVGYFTSGFCSGSSRMNVPSTSNPCAATEAHNYYEWTTVETTTQDYDMYVRWKVPSDFDNAGMANVAFDAYGWRTNSTGEVVEISIFDDDDTTTPCGSLTNVATGTATWTQTAITVTGCDFDANEFVTIRVHIAASANDFARLGEMRFTYKSAF